MKEIELRNVKGTTDYSSNNYYNSRNSFILKEIYIKKGTTFL